MTRENDPPRRHGLFHNGRKRVSHTIWHVATEDWPQKHEVIHHIDEDPFNNELGNLQLMTKSEHNVLHHNGAKHSEETRAKISASSMGKTFSKESRAKMSASLMGNTHKKDWFERKEEKAK